MRYYFYLIRKKRTIIWIIALLLLGIYIFRYIDKNIKPTVVAISEIRARAVTTQAINDTIKNKIKGILTIMISYLLNMTMKEK